MQKKNPWTVPRVMQRKHLLTNLYRVIAMRVLNSILPLLVALT